MYYPKRLLTFLKYIKIIQNWRDIISNVIPIDSLPIHKCNFNPGLTSHFVQLQKYKITVDAEERGRYFLIYNIKTDNAGTIIKIVLF